MFGSTNPGDLFCRCDIVVRLDPRWIEAGVDMFDTGLLGVDLVYRRGKVLFDMLTPVFAGVRHIPSQPVGVDKGDLTRLGDGVVPS